MGELWRSQPMQLVQLYVQIEAAHDTVDELGNLGLIQFRDLNPHVNAFQRNFINEVKRTDEMERRLRYFEAQIVQFNEEAAEQESADIKIEEGREQDLDKRVHMDEFEAKFEELEKQIQEMNSHQEALHRNYNQLIELKHVLEKDDSFFAEADMEDTNIVEEEGVEKGITGKLGFISGVIERKTFHTFERILYRATRGNLYMKVAPINEKIKDPHTGERLDKNVFCIFFPGQQLQVKIKKICESFGANLYPCPEKPKDRKNLLAQVHTRLEDLNLLIERGWDQRCQVLGSVALNLRYWQTKVRKEKAIYHTMNMFNYDHGRKCLIAEGWCPENSIETVQLTLRVARERSGALVPSILNCIPAKEDPPTYFKTNKFTSAFQSIVDSYGVARYREINPAVLTIVTFPFEFGMMFGDIGHGFLLLLYAFLMIRKERDWEGKKINEMFEITYYGRYVLLLMAIFAIYQGILYNEFFAQPLDFGTNWWLQVCDTCPNDTFWRHDPHYTYPFGVDPIWKGAGNELIFYNSLKMKMSIIIGVLQMTAGLIFHFLNGLHFKQYLDVFFEFIPRLLFLECIFGYLCFLIIYKWNKDYIGQDIINAASGRNSSENVGEYAGTAQAQVILNELIYMFLPGGPKNNPIYPGQFDGPQTVLVVVALLSVPIMAIPKPLILRYQHQQKQKTVVHHVIDEEGVDKVAVDTKGGHGHGHGHGEFDFGEIFVHQILETIEFVLGSVSHTASYLRLWALSLAHSELATVFWDKILFELIAVYGAQSSLAMAIILGFVGISGWMAATFLVLMFMESLSAFLHALRLHWVEFQSKFYKGDGYAFVPFSYKIILNAQEETA